MLILVIVLVGLLGVVLSWGAVVTRNDLEVRMQVLELLELAMRRRLPIVPLLRKAAFGQPRRLARALNRLARDIEQGEDLSEALEWALPDSFPPAVRAAIAAAAATRELPDVLCAMTQHTDDALALRHRSTMALLYPFMLLVLIVILSDAVGFLASAGTVMPALPVLSLSFGGKLVAHPVVGAVVCLSLLLGVCSLWRRWPFLRRLGRDIRWRMPWRSRAARLLAMGQYLQTWACLVRAGVALPTAMVRGLGAVDHRADEARLRDAARQLAAGLPFVEAVRCAGLPPFASAAVCAASQAAPEQLADAMERSAREVRRRHVAARERLLCLANPVLLGLVGLVVATFVLVTVSVSHNVSQGRIYNQWIPLW